MTTVWTRWIAAAVLACAAVSSAGAGTISGRVLGPDGHPAADAPVTWFAVRSSMQSAADATSGTKPTPAGRTRTDADGRFQAAVDPAGPPVSLRIEPAGAPSVELDGPYEPGETVHLPDIDLPTPVTVSGIVAGSDGKPCEQDTDCVSDACDAVSHACISDQCADHRRDGLETDVDCGGPDCNPCTISQRCNSNRDCQAGHICVDTGYWNACR